jgi:hypothetical protein
VQQTETDPIASKHFRNIESSNAAVGLIDRANHLTINIGNLHAIQKQPEMFANAIFIGEASYNFP